MKKFEVVYIEFFHIRYPIRTRVLFTENATNTLKTDVMIDIDKMLRKGLKIT